MLGKLSKSYADAMQNIVRKYRVAGGEWPATMRSVAEWAIEKGMWELSSDQLISKCARELADAMRQDTHEDSQGRVVRSMVAAKVMRADDNGKEHQEWLWADLREANHGHVVSSFISRHDNIRGDIEKLKTDVGSYNDNHLPKGEKPIQILFEFGEDVMSDQA